MLNNVSIKTKFNINTLIAITFLSILIILGIYNVNKLVKQSEFTYNTVVKPLGDLNHITYEFDKIRVRIRDLSLMQDLTKSLELENEINDSIKTLQIKSNGYLNFMNNYNIKSGEEFNNFMTFYNNLDEFFGIVQKIINLGIENEYEEINLLISNELNTIVTIQNNAIDNLININVLQAEKANTEAFNQRTKVIIVMTISLLISVAILLAISTLIKYSIVNPINKLLEIAEDVSKGKLNAKIPQITKDEIGELTGSFQHVIEAITSLIKKAEEMALNHKEGNIDFLINTDNFSGDYKKVADGVNDIAKIHVGAELEIIECLKGFGDGNFNVNIRNFPGKQAVINESISNLKNNLSEINLQIDIVARAVIEGNLNTRADVSKFSGDWTYILKELNLMLTTISNPINEISEVLLLVANGELTKKVEGEYQGEFEDLKNGLNLTIESLNSYISEISEILTNISNNNINIEIKREYKGDFINIKDSLNAIITNLNGVLGEINSSTQQVNMGAKLISESSMSLAEGATRQASSVQELNATIETINEQTHKNAENATNAMGIAKISKDNAESGNDQMIGLLEAIGGIKDSSDNIAKIIKTIEDISFQTNLLALNAAVESARAGTHGKGFAVVAEEVRSLAARSQEAAKETTLLIEDSIRKVNEGTERAKSTAKSLSEIVYNVTEVSSLIENIALESNEQANIISQVAIGLGEISQVIQSNSSTSEETAAASEELSSQSDMLQNMIEQFSFKN